MLFILTGDVRTGKTTWLAARVRELEAAGVPVRGVLAPGVWRDGEKVGIENALLPSHERVLFATPAVSGCASGLGWDFDAASLARVNAHLAGLASAAAGGEGPGLLVIDEVGPLELRRGGGLTAALALLADGPTPAWPHALVVVRAALAEEACARLAQSWDSAELISPTVADARHLREVLLGEQSLRSPEK